MARRVKDYLCQNLPKMFLNVQIVSFKSDLQFFDFVFDPKNFTVYQFVGN
jgi:hypothetical protein